MKKLIILLLFLYACAFAQLPVKMTGKAGSENKPMTIDSTTWALNVIDYAHHEIHSGSHFKAGYQDASMATGDTISLVVVTPNTTKYAHWKLTSQSTGEAIIQVFEACTATDSGTSVTVWNRNRNSSKTNTVLVGHTPTLGTPIATARGTKMVERWIGGTGFKEDSGGEHRGDNEFILKANTKYLVLGIAVGDGIKVAIGCDWYEHTDK